MDTTTGRQVASRTRINVRVTGAERAALDRLAAQGLQTVSDIVREAIRAHVIADEAPKK
jgi:uncharacterized protein (DUF1778 family)